MFLWALPKSDVNSRKRCSYGLLTGTIQKVCKITENTKWGNVKSGFTVVASVTLISTFTLLFHFHFNMP